MTISFIELDFHHDVVDGFCRTFSNSEVKVNFYIKKAVFDKLQKYEYVNSQNFTWTIYQNGSRKSFLKSNIDKINNANCVFINTLSSEPKAYLSVKFIPKVILRVHNLNKLFRPIKSINIPIKPFYLWKAFSYFIREVVYGQYLSSYKKIQKLTDYFTFPDESVKQFALENNFVTINKIAPSFSLKVFEEDNNIINSSKKDVFSITIIGGIDFRRRDYQTVLNVLNRLVPQLKHKIKLTLLGNSRTKHGNELLPKLQKLENDNFKLEYFNQSVSQEKFDEVISNTSIILSPIKVETLVEIYHETYGKTKISGSILDSIRFPIFTILPAQYSLGKEKQDLFGRYKDAEELFFLLKKYIENQNELSHKTIEYKNFVKQKYSALGNRQEFVEFINKL